MFLLLYLNILFLKFIITEKLNLELGYESDLLYTVTSTKEVYIPTAAYLW